MQESLDLLASRQHGLLTKAQLLEKGHTDRQVEGLVARRNIARIRRGVYRIAGAPRTREQAWMAAVLAGGEACVLSHASAAALHRFPATPRSERIHLLTDRSRPQLPGVVSHSTIRLPAEHRTVRSGIPVTTPERTLADISGSMTPSRLGLVADQLHRDQQLTLTAFARCAEEVPVSGRRASRSMRLAVAERSGAYDPGGSAQELDVLALLRRAGVALPVQQHRVDVDRRTYYLDFAYPGSRHAMEWDTFTFHGQVTAFHADRERLRRLQRSGWRVWPLTNRTEPREIIEIATLATA